MLHKAVGQPQPLDPLATHEPFVHIKFQHSRCKTTGQHALFHKKNTVKAARDGGKLFLRQGFEPYGVKNQRPKAKNLFNLRRSLFDSQISTRSASPISVVFWSNIIRPTDDDLSRLRGLYADVSSVVTTAVAPGNRFFFAIMVLSALLVWVAGRRVLERFLLVRLMVRWMPEGRLRRSALALAFGLSTVLTISVATSLLRWGVISDSTMHPHGSQRIAPCEHTAGP